MNEWQPIKTAPRDGTLVIYLYDVTSVGECRWFVDDENNDEGWWDYTRDCDVNPRYWLPFPPPPQG
jgi:hypothetical protein